MTQGILNVVKVTSIAICGLLSLSEGSTWSGGWAAGITFCLTIDFVFDNLFKK